MTGTLGPVFPILHNSLERGQSPQRGQGSLASVGGPCLGAGSSQGTHFLTAGVACVSSPPPCIRGSRAHLENPGPAAWQPPFLQSPQSAGSFCDILPVVCQPNHGVYPGSVPSQHVRHSGSLYLVFLSDSEMNSVHRDQPRLRPTGRT